MAKKSSTIHIENCFWDLIDEYKNENNMSSRNTAIECILSEYKALKGIKQVAKVDRDTNVNEDKQKNDEIVEKIMQMENDMPD